MCEKKYWILEEKRGVMNQIWEGMTQIWEETREGTTWMPKWSQQTPQVVFRAKQEKTPDDPRCNLFTWKNHWIWEGTRREMTQISKIPLPFFLN